MIHHNLRIPYAYKDLARYFLAKSVPFGLRRFIPSYIYKHLWFRGLFSLRDNEQKKIGLFFHSGTIIENEIYWRGLSRGHEPLSMTLWIEIIKKLQPKVILDIGANTGIYGVVAKLINRNSTVHFFEPNPASLSSINKSLESNKIRENYFIHNIFLYDKSDGVRTVFMNSGSEFAYVYLDEVGGPNEHSISVPFYTLYDYFKLNHPEIDAIQLIKIDIEGSEFKALNGFKSYLSSNTVFLIEVLDNHSATELSVFFSSKDYIFLNIDDNRFTLNIDIELKRSKHWNILIVPKNMFSILKDTIFHGLIN